MILNGLADAGREDEEVVSAPRKMNEGISREWSWFVTKESREKFDGGIGCRARGRDDDSTYLTKNNKVAKS